METPPAGMTYLCTRKNRAGKTCDTWFKTEKVGWSCSHGDPIITFKKAPMAPVFPDQIVVNNLNKEKEKRKKKKKDLYAYVN